MTQTGRIDAVVPTSSKLRVQMKHGCDRHVVDSTIFEVYVLVQVCRIKRRTCCKNQHADSWGAERLDLVFGPVAEYLKFLCQGWSILQLLSEPGVHLRSRRHPVFRLALENRKMLFVRG
jgi:hypothetical protein